MISSSRAAGSASEITRDEELAGPAPANSSLPGAPIWRHTMRTSLTLACCGVAVAALAAGVSPGNAQYAAQLYPYCALSAANGATTCYYRSREECGGSCIS